MAKTAQATLVINADTSKASKAISKLIKNAVDGPNKALSKTSVNIDAVNDALKSNATSATLIKQKQGYLKTAVAQATEKLQAQRKALYDIKKLPNSDATIEYQKTLTREISNTEAKLKSLTKQMYRTSSVFAEQLKGMGSKLRSKGDSLYRLGNDLSNATMPLQNAFKDGVNSASAFSTKTSKVHSILVANGDAAAGQMQKIKRQVMALSNESGVSAKRLMEDTYQAISAGVKGKKAVAEVGAAEKLATAGFTDSAHALDVLTTITNAYGEAAGSANHQASVLITTQNLGKVTVDELSQTMARVIPIARMNHVSLEDLSAGYVALTKNGIKSGNATVYLKQMYSEFGKSGSKASKALQQSTGQTFDEFLAKGHSVGDALKVLQQYSETTGTKFQDLWSNMNAKSAAGSLLQNLDDYDTALSKLKNKSTDKTLSKAYEEMMNSPERRMKRLQNSIQNMKLNLGEALLPTLEPMVQSVTKAISSVSDAFQKLGPHTQGFVAKSLAAFAFVGPLITKLSSIPTVLGGISSIAGGALGGIAGTIAKISTAFSGLKSMKANPFSFLAAGQSLGSAASGLKGLASGASLANPAMLKTVAIIAAVAAAAILATKMIKHLHKRLGEKSKVQSAADKYQQAKINYQKGTGSKDAVVAAKASYDQAQAAYKKQYGKPAKVKFKSEADFDKTTYKNHVKAAKDYAKQAKEAAKANGANGKQQKEAYAQAYAKMLKVQEAQKKTTKGAKELAKANQAAAKAIAKANKQSKKDGVQKISKNKTVIQADKSDVNKKIQTAAKTGKSAKAKIKIEADTSGVSKQLDKLDEDIQKVSKKAKKIKAKIDAKGADKQIKNITKNLKSIKTKKAKISVHITKTGEDPKKLAKQIDGLSSKKVTAKVHIKQVGGKAKDVAKMFGSMSNRSIKVGIDTSGAGSKLTTLANNIKNIKSKKANIKVHISKTGENPKAISKQIGTLKNKSVSVKVKVKQSGTSVTKIASAINKLRSKSVTVKVQTKGSIASFKSLTKVANSTAKSISGKKLKVQKPSTSAAVSAVRRMKSQIVNILHSISSLKWKINRPRVPVFSMSGSFNPETGAVPHISVGWRKRAMQLGQILTSPTIFGMDNGQFLGAGEAGPEAVIGTHSLSELVYSAAQQSTLDMIRNTNNEYDKYYSGMLKAQENDYGYKYAQSLNNGITPDDLGYVDYSQEIVPPAQTMTNNNSSTNVGEIVFSPNIVMGSNSGGDPNNGNTEAEKLMRELKALGPEFVDYIMQKLSERQEAAYA